MDKKSVKIIVATHKKYEMPTDEMYMPLHVGAEGKTDQNGKPLDLGYEKDNTGDNISHLNASFCELTGLYWAWKNLDADFIGLAHYRRHFSVKKVGEKPSRVLTTEQVSALLESTDVVLPKKRKYYIETNYSQYVHAHHAEDLDITREIILEKCPEHIDAFDSSMKKTSGHRFNMFIMKRDKFDAYCSWLFDILFELERRLDISQYSQYDARVFGFVSERLLDVWLEANRIHYREIPYIFMEKQNWIVKGTKFLKRKISK